MGSAIQLDWAVVPSGTEEDTECAVHLEQETSVEIMENGPLGPRM